MDLQSWREWVVEIARKHGIPALRCALYRSGELQVVRTGRDTRPAPFASVTKLFTATLAMQLVADGDLDLDEPVGRRAGQLPAGAEKVTLRHLLSHSSGLACDAPDGPEETEGGLLFAPGTAFSYSNLGFSAVGRLIEDAAALDWRTAVSDFLLGPLGIEPAFLDEADVPRGAAPAAALAGDVTDLVAFARMHLRQREADHSALLDDDAVRAMAEPPFDTLPFGLADAWGLGWGVYGRGAHRWLGLDAAGAGTVCQLRIQPEQGTVLALQADTPAGAAAWQDLLSRMHDAGLPVGTYAPDAAADTEHVLPDCAGRWVNGGLTYRIHAADVPRGRDAPTGPAAVLEDDDGTQYFLTGRGVRFFAARHSRQPEVEHLGRFLLDPVTGRAERMQFGGRVLRRAA